MTTEHEGKVTGTRVFGNLGPEQYPQILTPLLENSRTFGPCLIISQTGYEYLEQLRAFLATQEETDLRLSETTGNQSPADMCNQIIKYCADRNLAYFGIVSSELSGFIPRVMPEMFDRLKANPNLTTVGVAIDGVHNLELLERVKLRGRAEITTDNYATVFHNNAFSVQRLRVDGVSFEQRLFPRESDQFRLGTVKIDDKDVPVGGNEEIALVLKLLAQGMQVNVELLAGKYTIVRDAEAEISSIAEKVRRRAQVAKVYQKHFGVGDEALTSYLNDHFVIDL